MDYFNYNQNEHKKKSLFMIMIKMNIKGILVERKEYHEDRDIEGIYI